MKRSWKDRVKRGLALLLALVLMSSLIPDWSPLADLRLFTTAKAVNWTSKWPTTSGDYTFTDSIYGTFTAPQGTTTIDLAGHNISSDSGGGTLITVPTGATLIIRNSGAGLYTGQVKKTAGGKGSCIYVNGGTFKLESGTIIGTMTNTSGGGVCVVNGGKFEMTGGTIQDSSAPSTGGGVMVDNGTFNMSGGTITSCTAKSGGGGVYIKEGTFNMSSGTISSCSSSSGCGGGVCVGTKNDKTANFYMSGGTISNCEAKGSSADTGNGGGVNIFKGKFVMSGGTIKNCSATRNAGGVCVYNIGTFEMSGNAQIQECKAPAGGGVQSDGTFYLKGGSITKNTATGSGGGGVDISSGTFKMNHGEITGNTAHADGGGIKRGNGTVEITSSSNATTGERYFSIITGNTSESNKGHQLSGQMTITYYCTVDNGTNDITSDVTKDSWTLVTFDKKGGTDGTSTTNFKYNNQIPASITVPTRTGYTFKGYNDENAINYYDAEGKRLYSALWTTIVATKTLNAQWTANTYTIQFDANGGQGAPSGGTATYDQDYTLPSDVPTMTGYTFAEWNTKADGKGTSYAKGAKVKNLASAQGAAVTLYAQYSVNQYTITLDQQSGTGGTTSVKVPYGSAMPAATMPTRTGYTFEGYFDATTNGTKYYNADGSSAKNWDKTGDNKLYARWTANQYKVTLDQKGGSNGDTSVTATYDSAMLTATMPTRTGYTFQGYFDAETGGTKYYNANGTSAKTWDKTADTTLYAQWTANNYNVTLDLQNGNGGTTAVTATYDGNMPSATMPTRTGYTFGGYFDAVNGGGKQYYNADGNSANTWDKDGAATLYAKWTPNPYKITFDKQGGTDGTTGVPAQLFDGDMTAVTPPKKPGYSFIGYFDAKTGGKQYYDADGFSVNKWDKPNDATLYAQWSVNHYTVQYWSQDDREVARTDAAYANEDNNIAYGSFKLKSAAELELTREHYDFVGWNLYQDQDWAMYQAGKEYSGGLTTETNGTAVIYAAWAAKPQFTVTYDANGGQGAPNSGSVYRDDTYTISTTEPTRDGYTFTGWKWNGKADYKGGNTIPNVQGNITLTAQWQRNKSVSYHPNGGSYAVAPDTMYPAKNATVNIDFTKVPTRDGYDFKGYATNAGATSATYTVGGTQSFIMGNESVTLYAVWAPVSYSITYTGCEGRYEFSDTQPTSVVRDEDYSFTLKINKEYDTENLSVSVNHLPLETPVAVVSGNYKLFTYEVKKAAGTQEVYIKGIAKTPRKISYVLNGGSIVGDAATYYEEGTAVTLPTTVERSGYTFAGWYANENFTGSAVTQIGTEATGEKTFYAKWDANLYTIEFNANGGSGSVANVNASYDAVVTLPTSDGMTNGGYAFLGWDTNKNAIAPTYKAGDAVKNLTALKNGTVTLYAIWDEEHYSVTYHLNGGMMENTFALIESVKHGSTITTPASNALKKTGNEFQGWADSEGSAVVKYGHNTNITVEGNMDLYAVWLAGSYTITYYNGAIAVGDPQDMTFGTPAALRSGAGLTAPDGKEFLGWSRSNTATTAEYVGGQNVTAIGDGTVNAVNLYAVWGDKTAKYLTYNANGGAWIGSVPDSVVDYGDGSVTLAAYDSSRLSRPGYTRDGWLIGSKTYADGETIVISENTTAFANWKTNTYTVKFNANGGKGAMSNQSMTYGEEAELTKSEFTRSGYTFKGWARRENGPLAYSDGESVLNLTNLADSEVNLFAVWEAIDPVWVVYNANGGMNAPAAAPFAKDGTATVTSLKPTLAGYDFKEWNTQADGNGTSYAPNATFTIKENTTLYAIWTEKTVYHVTYDLSGGVGLVVDPNSYFVGDKVTVRTDNAPERLGYTFAGWKLDDTTYKTGTFTITDKMDAEIVLTAQWTVNTYKIVFNGSGSTGGTMSDMTGVKYDETKTLTANSFTKTGYQFRGWAIAAGGDVVYADKASVKNLCTENGSSITLYAVWKAVSVKVTLNDGLSDTTDETFTATYGEPLRFDKNVVYSREGYTFGGFYTAQNGGGTQCFDANLNSKVSTSTFTTNTTLYAKWTVKSFPVTYMNADRTAAATTKKFTYAQKSVTLASATDVGVVVASGYTFRGWTRNSAEYSRVDYTAGQTVDLWNGGAGTVLYPVIVKDETYTVTYNANGGTGFPVDNAEYYTGQSATVKFDKIPTREHYVFQGWGVTPNETTPQYTMNGDKAIEMHADVTLYAVWALEEYKVTFDANEGTGSKEITVTYGEESSAVAATATDFSRDNYRLIGWSLSAKGDVVVEPGKPLSMAITGGKAVTLYAVWETADYMAIEVESNCGAKVTFTSGNVKDGFLGLGKSRAQLGKTVTFTVSGIDPDYTGVTVKLNGEELEAKDGTYTFTVGEKNVITIDAEGYKYTVTYYANGGTGGEVKQNATSTDLPLQLLGTNTDFTRDGYRLAGWAENGRGSIRYGLNEEIEEPLTDKVGGNVNLYAVWKAKAYTVTFDSQGGSPVKEFTRGYNDKLGTLEVPTREGYHFEGWYLADGVTPVTERTVVNEMLTAGNYETVSADQYTIKLTAHWAVNTYNVTVHRPDKEVGLVTFDTTMTLASGTSLDIVTPQIRNAPYNTVIEFMVTPTPGYQMKDLIVTANGTPLEYDKIDPETDVGTFHFTLTEDTVLLVHDGGNGVNFTVSIEDYHGVYDGTNHLLKVEIAPDIALLSNITYQWYKDNHLLNGATQQTFKVKNVADSGDYYCVVKATESKTGNSKQYTTNTATVEITKAQVTVTAVDRSVVYGNDLPTFAFNYDGFVAGETSRVITGKPAVTTEYEAGSDVKAEGYEVNVNVDGISADNYTFVAGDPATLTVSPRPLTVKWNRTTFFYDGEEHTVLAVPTNLVGNDEVELNYDGVQSAIYPGDYAVTITGCTGADSGNYKIIPEDGISHNWSIGKRAEGDEPQEIGVIISRNKLNMVVGDEKQLTATVAPAWVEQTVSWASSDEDVVTVNDGNLTAVGAGTAEITVTTADGYSASCFVTVTEEIPASATDLRLSKRTAIITTKDGTVDLNISLIGFDEETMEIFAGSSDDLVAKAEISHHNRVLKITADDNGTATIKVEMVNKENHAEVIASDTCDVTVFVSDTKVVESVKETFTGYVIHYTDGTEEVLNKTRTVEFDLNFDALISPDGLKSTFDELSSFFDKLTERRLAAKRAQSDSQTEGDSSWIESDDSVESTEPPTVYGGGTGRDGVGIVSIEKTGSKDNIDTYTISYSDGTTSTFIVTNGVDGHTPVITIGSNGNWFIDGVDTGKNAVVKDASIWGFVGIGIPVAGLIAAAIFMFLKIRKLENILMGKK